MAVEAELGHEASLLPPDNEFVARLEGFVVGVDPRNGDLDGTLYRHGRSGFAVDPPPGWETELAGSMALAAPSEGDVVLIVAPTLFSEPTVDQVITTMASLDSIMLWEQHEYTVGGLPVVRGKFRTVEEPALLGVFQLVQGSEGVITLLAVGTQPDWGANGTSIVLALNSQRRLTEADTAALQPTRISLVAAEDGQTLREIASGPQELPMLRQINRVRANTVLEAGRLLKRVQVPAEFSAPAPVDSKKEQPLADPFVPTAARSQDLPDPFVPKVVPLRGPDPSKGH